jgi:hypothetical protein
MEKSDWKLEKTSVRGFSLEQWLPKVSPNYQRKSEAPFLVGSSEAYREKHNDDIVRPSPSVAV